MGQSDFLFAPPGALIGAARLLDLGGTMDQYNESRSGPEADVIALAMDTAVIGQDMATAIATVIPEGLRQRRIASRS